MESARVVPLTCKASQGKAQAIKRRQGLEFESLSRTQSLKNQGSANQKPPIEAPSGVFRPSPF